MNAPHSITELVKNNKAKYLFCRGSKLIYEITVGEYRYEFPIDVSDKNEVGEAIFNRTEKAMFLMRYIRKAIKNNELQWFKT